MLSNRIILFRSGQFQLVRSYPSLQICLVGRRASVNRKNEPFLLIERNKIRIKVGLDRISCLWTIRLIPLCQLQRAESTEFHGLQLNRISGKRRGNFDAAGSTLFLKTCRFSISDVACWILFHFSFSLFVMNMDNNIRQDNSISLYSFKVW